MARRNKTRSTIAKICNFHQPFCSSHVFLYNKFTKTPSLSSSTCRYEGVDSHWIHRGKAATWPNMQSVEIIIKVALLCNSFHFQNVALWHLQIFATGLIHEVVWCSFVPPKDVFFSTNVVSMSSSNPFIPFNTWETELECYFPLSCFLYRMKERTTPFNWWA